MLVIPERERGNSPTVVVHTSWLGSSRAVERSFTPKKFGVRDDTLRTKDVSEIF